MRGIIILLSIFLYSMSHAADDGNKHQIKKERKKREFSIIKLIEAAVKVGETLTGTSLNALRDATSDISMVGTVENPTKWQLSLVNCKALDGKINNPIQSVSTGQKEGFASHGTSGSLSSEGTLVKCTFTINKRSAFIHMVYNIPQDTTLTSNPNVLAFAVCNKNETDCQNIDGSKMLKETHSYLKKRVYKDTVSVLVLCKDGICITGTMGTSKKSIIKVKVYPEKFENLETSVRKKLSDGGVSSVAYNEFIKEELENSNFNNGMVNIMSTATVAIMAIIAILSA